MTTMEIVFAKICILGKNANNVVKKGITVTIPNVKVILTKETFAVLVQGYA